MLKRKHLTKLFFVLSLFMFTFFLQLTVPGVNAAPVVVNHSSIAIDGNEQLDAFCAGNGTSGNATSPHRIEDLEITWDGPQIGFNLSNIDRYLILYNVSVSDYFQSSYSKGLYLKNCSNILINAVYSYNNSHGMWLENTSLTTIVNSSATSNKVNGITFKNSHNNNLYNVVVLENGLKENEGNGMNMISSDYNTIEYCLFLESQGHGLFLQDSYYNEVFDSEFLLNKGECYVILNDPDGTNNVHDNNCRKSSIPGMSIGILAIISVGTVVILVITTLRFKKKSKTA